MNGIKQFEAQVAALGPDGAEVLRKVLVATGALEGLDEATRQAMRGEARLRFHSREFTIAEAAKVKMPTATWGLAGGAAARDAILHGVAVAVFVSLASAPDEFEWRMTDAGIVFRAR